MFMILRALNFLLFLFYLVVALYQLSSFSDAASAAAPCIEAAGRGENQNNATPSAALRQITFGTLTFHFISSAASRIDIAANGIIPLSIIAP